MVTPMTKYTFLMHHLSIDEFIEKLGSLGVVDVTVSKSDYTPVQRDMLNGINTTKLIHERLNIFKAENKALIHEQLASQTPFKTADEAISCYNEAHEQLDKLTTQHSKLVNEIRDVEVWGDFDINLIDKLESKGIKLSFYIIASNAFNEEWNNIYNIEIVKRDNHYVHFVVVTTKYDQETEIEGVSPVKRPQNDARQKREELANIEGQIMHYKSVLLKVCASEDVIKSKISSLEYAFKESLIKSSNSVAVSDKVYIVEGWTPEGKYELVDSAFEAEENMVVIKDQPTLEDNPPILLKNNRFAKMCEMISRLYSMPSYHELDLTPFFAPFFVLFVGFCFGDLGYALLLFIAAFVANIVIKDKSIRPITSLIMWCCVATMFIGCLTGSFFGIELSKVEMFKGVKFLGQMDMFSLALLVGLLQILYAMFVKSYALTKFKGFKYAISTLSWALLIIISCAAFALPELGVSGFSVSSPIYIAIVSVLMILNILFLDASKKNLFSNIGIGIWELYNNITGLLGDVLSYIRLFALGLSGSIIASVFNDLAVGMSPDIPVLKYVVMVIILLIGHGINMFMCAIGSFVHPLRLTFVEFYKNAGFEGGGREYEPFKVEK